MVIKNDKNASAIIVAIEKYKFCESNWNINTVDYAENDAAAFKSILIDQFGLNENQISYWVGKNASFTTLANELPYTVSQLSKDDRFYFYYAGHGFYAGGYNRITAWDSHPNNLVGTTISIKNALLDPLQKSGCTQNLIFIDACAKHFNELSVGRELISNMNRKEFENFIRSTPYTAMFFSCSPGEASYPSHHLKHGIWTWHLIQALKGDIDDAIINDCYITDTSLRDYLKNAVPEYIRQNTEIHGTQNPLATISASNTFEILKIPNNTRTINQLPDIRLKYDKYFLRNFESDVINRLDGFNKGKGHFIPESVNSFAHSFVQRLLEDDIQNEIKTIYDNIKSILGLKRREIKKALDIGSGSIDTKYFRYRIDSGQDQSDCTNFLITRTLLLLVPFSKLPTDVGGIFPFNFDEIVIPIIGKTDFEDIVDSLEDYIEINGGTLDEDEDEGVVSYIPDNRNVKYTINIYDYEFSIKPFGKYSCLSLIKTAEAELKQLIGMGTKLLK